jgi:hypothetical protein
VDRVERFLTSNFSERVRLGSVNEEEEYQRIRAACQKRGDGADSKGLQAFAEENFDMAGRIDDYCALYKALQYRNPATFADLILHSILTARRLTAAKRSLAYAIER